jgi:hypothetical protein
MKTIRSKRGAIRRYNAIIKQCYKDAKGGLAYGLDWPTLYATWPDRAKEIIEIEAQLRSLPD